MRHVQHVLAYHVGEKREKIEQREVKVNCDGDGGGHQQRQESKSSAGDRLERSDKTVALRQLVDKPEEHHQDIDTEDASGDDSPAELGL